MGDGRGELAGLGEAGAQETGDLLDQGVRGQEGVVLARELLDQLLVLVEFLEVVRGHGVDAGVFGAVDVVLVAEDALKMSVSRNQVIKKVAVSARTRCPCQGEAPWAT